jgi:hypothetical protein
VNFIKFVVPGNGSVYYYKLYYYELKYYKSVLKITNYLVYFGYSNIFSIKVQDVLLVRTIVRFNDWAKKLTKVCLYRLYFKSRVNPFLYFVILSLHIKSWKFCLPPSFGQIPWKISFNIDQTIVRPTIFSSRTPMFIMLTEKVVNKVVL